MAAAQRRVVEVAARSAVVVAEVDQLLLQAGHTRTAGTQADRERPDRASTVGTLRRGVDDHGRFGGVLSEVSLEVGKCCCGRNRGVRRNCGSGIGRNSGRVCHRLVLRGGRVDRTQRCVGVAGHDRCDPCDAEHGNQRDSEADTPPITRLPA